MRRLFSIFLTFWAIILSFVPAQSRWATYDDAPFEYLFFNRDVDVKADGSTEEIIEWRLKILNENGRNCAMQRDLYNSSITEIKVLEAKSITNCKELTVPEGMIENKPLASSTAGFDQLYQVLIPFSNIKIGSEIYLKLQVLTKKQPLPAYFENYFRYGGMGYWRQSRARLRSELPFHTFVNDPGKKLEVKEGKDGKLYTLNINLKQPVFEELILETKNTILHPNDTTWVQVATYSDSKQLARAMADSYEPILRAPLPPKLLSIKKAAEQEKSDTQKINAVLAELSEAIHYMGDWRTIEGRLHPRSLNIICESGIGDCKDFSVATAAILRSMGYKAQVALVMRDFFHLPEKSLPCLGKQNHAMVKVTNKTDRVFWIDPTNITSFSDGIYPDIAGRAALILDPQNPCEENIPDIDHRHAKVNQEVVLTLQKDGGSKSQGKFKLTGENALGVTEEALSSSRESIAESFIHSACGNQEVLNQSVALPKSFSRIVEDVEIEYSYEQENTLIQSTAGPAIVFRNSWPNYLLRALSRCDGWLVGDFPHTRSKKITIKNTKVQDLGALSYKIMTPWVEAKRECAEKNGDIEILEEVKFLKRVISPQEFKSPQYRDFRRQLEKHCKSYVVVCK